MRDKDQLILENLYDKIGKEKKNWDFKDFPNSKEEHIEYKGVNYYIPYKITGETPDDFEILAIIPHEGQGESDEPLYNYHDGIQSLHDNPNEDIRNIYQIAGRKIYDRIEDETASSYEDSDERDWDSERKSKEGY